MESQTNKCTKVVLSCRKGIQEQPYEPLEFTATVELTFAPEDTKESIRQAIGAARRMMVSEIGSSFDAYFAKREEERAACQG